MLNGVTSHTCVFAVMRLAPVFLLALLATVLAVPLGAQDFPRFGDDLYRPRLRQSGKAQPLLGAYVEGENLGFTFVGSDGGVRSVRARIDGAVLSGTLRFAVDFTAITGRRQ